MACSSFSVGLSVKVQGLGDCTVQRDSCCSCCLGVQMSFELGEFDLGVWVYKFQRPHTFMRMLMDGVSSCEQECERNKLIS